MKTISMLLSILSMIIFQKVSCWNTIYNLHPLKYTFVNRNILTERLLCGAGVHTFNKNQSILYSSNNANIEESSFSLSPASWKNEGEKLIIAAAQSAGALEEQISIQWKPGRVIVTIDGSVCINQMDNDNNDNDSTNSNEVEYDDDGFSEDDIADFEAEFMRFEQDDENDVDSELLQSMEGESTNNEGPLNIVAIARAINGAFEAAGEGSVAYTIAVNHEIEVTTPGAPDELYGIMFESYKGFNVFVSVLDAKTNKLKTVEGKLVERNDQHTIINEKGRMRKLKNELVQSVKLPKAKKEKGAR